MKKLKFLKPLIITFGLIFGIILIVGFLRMKFYSSGPKLKDLSLKEYNIDKQLKELIETTQPLFPIVERIKELPILSTTSVEKVLVPLIQEEAEKIAQEESRKLLQFSEKYLSLIKVDNDNKNVENYFQELNKIQNAGEQVNNLEDVKIYLENSLNKLVSIKTPPILVDYHRLWVFYYSALFYIIKERQEEKLDVIRKLVLDKMAERLLNLKKFEQ